ncbi:MAG: 2-phospho-L-lactate/phosphoenolpyruvate guanylyltransferase, partial [Micromonosporaceae bacterium]|nr:2-phospho-L-lactate/phosphoenolpyruvate guanylyltransferase [Micromonosporaceae bacterium]
SGVVDAAGANRVPDGGEGLNAALVRGADHAAALVRGADHAAALVRGADLDREADHAAGVPVVALTADLPALRPAELAAALTELAEGTEPTRHTALTRHTGLTGRTGRRGYVPDARGTGTTMLAALAGVGLDPRFGPGSAAAHRASGAVELLGDWPSVRQDVDTADDLAAAAALGLGPWTAALLQPPDRYRGPHRP